jgi:hypothetical protein
MRAALIVHLVALALGLALAFSALKAPDDKKADSEEQTLLDGTLEDLERVSYSSQDGDVTLTPVDDGGERSWAVELVREVADKPTAGEPQADAGVAGDGGTLEAEKKPRRFRFPAGRPVTRMLDKLAPFVVKRTIDDVPAERLASMGFGGDDVGTLEVTVKGRSLSFMVGGQTYGGSQRYLKDKEGRIHLAPGAIFRGLEGTETRLSERRIVPLDVDEITQVLVAVGDKSRVFVHQDREQPKKRYFAAEEAPEEKSDEASAVVTDLRRLRARAWLLPEEIDLDGRELLASFTVRRHEAGELSGKVFSAKDGTALVQVGNWSAHVTEGMAKGLVDDINAALP